MSLKIEGSKLIVTPPNSESPVIGQHVGTKSRSVGSFYMSEASSEVMNYFDLGHSTYYIDFTRTVLSIEKIIGYVVISGKEYLFKKRLLPQLELIEKLRDTNDFKDYKEIPEPIILPSRKYFKLDFDNYYAKIFNDLLFGDCCEIVFEKLGNNVIILYVEARNDFKENIDKEFGVNK